MNTFRFSQRSRYILLAGVLGLGSLTAQAVAADGKGANHAVAITQQSQTIKGTVVDNTGEPVIGANVLVKGTTTGVITDIDGNFTLEAPVGSTLVISFIGYETREVKATVAPMNIVLGDDAQALEEVVVVGYGVQKKATVTGSVSSVKGGELKAAGTANVTNTVAGCSCRQPKR